MSQSTLFITFFVQPKIIYCARRHQKLILFGAFFTSSKATDCFILTVSDHSRFLSIVQLGLQRCVIRNLVFSTGYFCLCVVRSGCHEPAVTRCLIIWPDIGSKVVLLPFTIEINTFVDGKLGFIYSPLMSQILQNQFYF